MPSTGSAPPGSARATPSSSSAETRTSGTSRERSSVSIEGITINQADGTATERPIHASNLVITKLNTEDAWRMDSLSKNKEVKE